MSWNVISLRDYPHVCVCTYPPPPHAQKTKSTLNNHTGKTAQAIQEAAAARGLNVRVIDTHAVGLSFGESITKEDVQALLGAFGVEGVDVGSVAAGAASSLPAVGVGMGGWVNWVDG